MAFDDGYPVETVRRCTAQLRMLSVSGYAVATALLGFTTDSHEDDRVIECHASAPTCLALSARPIRVSGLLGLM